MSGNSPLEQDGGASALCAGGWGVVRRSSYGGYHFFERAQIDAVNAKTVYAKVGPGRRLTRVKISDLILVADEDAARRLCAQLDSAKGEAMRRERAARAWYATTVAKLYAPAASPDQSGAA